MGDAVERLIARLFRNPPGGQVTPQVVAARVLRRLRPTFDFPASRARAKWLSRHRRAIEWRELDRLGLQIEGEVDGPLRRNRQSSLPNAELRADLELMDLSQALLWGWQRRTPSADPPDRYLCMYCHRPAVGMTAGGRSRPTPVCAWHTPRTAQAQRAARLVRWAGGHVALHDRVVAEMIRIRAEASDSELEGVLARSQIDRVARRWWAGRPDLELPIRILAFEYVEAKYRSWVEAQRVDGGRTRAVPPPILARAAKKVQSGIMSIRAAARVAGVSEATLRRYLAR